MSGLLSEGEILLKFIFVINIHQFYLDLYVLYTLT